MSKIESTLSVRLDDDEVRDAMDLGLMVGVRDGASTLYGERRIVKDFIDGLTTSGAADAAETETETETE